MEVIMRITNDSMVRCQWCDEEYEAGEWNDNTFKACTSRSMRRSFKEITSPKAWEHNAKFFYKCPGCGQWLRGNQLVLLDSDGNIVHNMGGTPIFKVIKQEDD